MTQENLSIHGDTKGTRTYLGSQHAPLNNVIDGGTGDDLTAHRSLCAA